MTDQDGSAQAEDWREQLAALEQLDAWLRTPMLVLSFVWLVLVVVELAWGSSPALGWLSTSIWVVFVLEFLLRFALAPEKLGFLRGNWLTVLALLAPALRLVRVFRFLRAARGLRGLRLVRIVGTANRGMNALRGSLGRRGAGSGRHPGRPPRLPKGPAAWLWRAGRQQGYRAQHGAKMARACPAHNKGNLR